MKKQSIFLALTPSALWVIPKLLDHFGRAFKKVRGNVFNIVDISERDVENYLEDLGLPMGSYQLGIGSVTRWPLPVRVYEKVLSDKDFDKLAEQEKVAGFVKVLVLGALKSLKVASTMTLNFRLASIVRMLEEWTKAEFKG